MSSAVVPFTLMLVVALAGCMPFRTSTPEIAGILLQNGAPLSGVKISSCGKGQDPKRCESFKVTTTDSQGQFFFASTWKVEPYVSFISEPVFNYAIDFQHLGRDFHWSEGGLGDTPKHVDLRCEIRNTNLCTFHAFEP